MATVTIQPPLIRHSSAPPQHPPALTLDASKFKAGPVPNKHLPYCSPGPALSPLHGIPVTPPASPPSSHSSLSPTSLLDPNEGKFPNIIEVPPAYSIDASILAAALDGLAKQVLPDPKQVFPWLHGLHPENQVQLAFFVARRKASRATPDGLRSITIVKAGGDLTRSVLKGSLSPDEVLCSDAGKDSVFLDSDPKHGFSVRNFHIQAAKMAKVSDIVVYGEGGGADPEVKTLAKRISQAQRGWAAQNATRQRESPKFHTLVISSAFHDFERNFPQLVAVDSQGRTTGHVLDFFQAERQEMFAMSKASEISPNVWLGPTPDPSLQCSSGGGKEPTFDILIEASDLAQVPDAHTLSRVRHLGFSAPQHLEFPSSGSVMPPRLPNSGTDPLTEMCAWIHQLANPQMTPDTSDDEEEAGDDIRMRTVFPSAHKVLIHCADGYTESTLLGLAYFMYAEAVPLHEAWLRLHCEKKRNFFAYPSDVSLLASLQPLLLRSSGCGKKKHLRAALDRPSWLSRMDGSLPSRVLPYMYLGNIGHANNPDLLKAMGITQVLSVGEPVKWPKGQREKWGVKNMLFIDRVQDNGVDPLMDEFERCLEFIGRGRIDGTATLVHCRVGVSRSATICIAEVMASLGLSFPRAYCFVRARRLNVIIQPHLRFAYELLKWDEVQQQKRGQHVQRELEWATIAREIAAMNKPYLK